MKLHNVLMISVFIGTAMFLGVLHAETIEGEKKGLWWLKRIVLSITAWPLFLFELVLDDFFWKGVFSLVVWLSACWIICWYITLPAIPHELIFFPVLTFFVTGLWWCIAMFVASIFQQLGKPWPSADYF